MSVLPQLERDLLEVARRRLPTGEAAVKPRPAGRRIVAWPRRLGLAPVLALLSVAVAVGVGVIAVGSLRHGKAPSLTLHARPSTTPFVAVNQLVGGLPQSGTRLGSRTAPVRITLYGDLECPVCRALVSSEGFARLLAGDVQRGQAQVVYRSFCTTTCDNRNLGVFDVQQAAAYAAGRQGLFWQYALLFYREQGKESTSYVNRRYLIGLADQIPGLNLKRWQTDRKSAGLLDQVRSEQAAATRGQLSGTPTLRVRGRKAVVLLATGNSSSLLARAVRAAQHGCPRHWRAVGFTTCTDLV